MNDAAIIIAIAIILALYTAVSTMPISEIEKHTSEEKFKDWIEVAADIAEFKHGKWLKDYIYENKEAFREHFTEGLYPSEAIEAELSDPKR